MIAHRPEADRLCCERREDEAPISAKMLRALPIRRFVDAATEAAARALAAELGREEKLELVVRGDHIEPDRLVEPQRLERRRGVPLPEEHFRRVADAYRAARAVGQAPTKTVAELMGASRSTAAHWVMEARRRGLLGPTRPRTAGEDGEG